MRNTKILINSFCLLALAITGCNKGGSNNGVTPESSVIPDAQMTGTFKSSGEVSSNEYFEVINKCDDNTLKEKIDPRIKVGDFRHDKSENYHNVNKVKYSSSTTKMFVTSVSQKTMILNAVVSDLRSEYGVIGGRYTSTCTPEEHGGQVMSWLDCNMSGLEVVPNIPIQNNQEYISCSISGDGATATEVYDLGDFVFQDGRSVNAVKKVQTHKGVIKCWGNDKEPQILGAGTATYVSIKSMDLASFRNTGCNSQTLFSYESVVTDAGKVVQVHKDNLIDYK